MANEPRGDLPLSFMRQKPPSNRWLLGAVAIGAVVGVGLMFYNPAPPEPPPMVKKPEPASQAAASVPASAPAADVIEKKEAPKVVAKPAAKPEKKAKKKRN
ncbi:MAG: hypothetical protein IT381_01700 [Deltaproteobacteria bacterium]|nr:hypothetical protein [Deltaproteobacteria bacterium]